MNHSETLQASSLWHVNVLVTLRVGGGGGVIRQLLTPFRFSNLVNFQGHKTF